MLAPGWVLESLVMGIWSVNGLFGVSCDPIAVHRDDVMNLWVLDCLSGDFIEHVVCLLWNT